SVASGFELSQNYPNPFNPSTTIAYNLKQAADVTLEVFNVTGQKVATLANGRKPAGQYEVNFDAADIASGIYFYTLNANGQSLTRKMVLMK
ncbi:MAG: T9SS type A sorting domain-containing protein, partial [Calditrichaeota bacterium]|nr:T9SS type A sorting domain-containing protein [Calditrichota bacterium]